MKEKQRSDCSKVRMIVTRGPFLFGKRHRGRNVLLFILDGGYTSTYFITVL